jgi:alpha-L-fucosidase 2
LCLVTAVASFGATTLAFAQSSQTNSDGLHADVEYGQAGGEKLLLDANVPSGTGTFPVAILVHGGGWSSGDKKIEIAPLLDPLTAANFTWFSIDYRLAPKNRWPACFDDVQTAIGWVKAHAAEYKGDPKRIALIGYSAGGQLVCLAEARAGEDTRVQAVVGLAPPTDIPADIARRGNLLSKSLQDLFGHPPGVDAGAMELMQEMSAISHLHPGLPPFLLIHGTEDQSVLYSQSVNFQAKLKENKIPCELVTIKGASHRITDWEKFDPTYKEQMIAWLKQTLGAENLSAGGAK